MHKKKLARMRRAARVRHAIRRQSVPRLTVYRSNCHIYAQVFSADGAQVVATASTLDAESKAKGAKAVNIQAATVIGNLIAERAMAKGIKQVAFDRSGFKYHGRLKALADAAREAGLEF